MEHFMLSAKKDKAPPKEKSPRALIASRVVRSTYNTYVGKTHHMV